MDFFRETLPWVLDGNRIPVTAENDHLGLIVSGIDEVDKNIDVNLSKGRKSLFALLGPAFSYKCLLSPALQCHLWRTYTSSVILSGLCALPARHTHSQPLTTFHRKILRGFLKLSQNSPIPAIHFLLAELPLEASLHLATFSLFWSVWSNPTSTMYQICKYLLMMSPDNSRTWCVHVRHLCRIYGMKDPLVLLQEDAWSKATWKTYTSTMVTSYHERKLREDALVNSRMGLFNIALTRLTGKPYYVLENIFSSYEVKKVRIHIKMLCQDYLTYGTLALQSAARGVTFSGHCRICPGEWDDIRHILTECHVTQPARDILLPQLVDLLAVAAPNLDWISLHEDKSLLCQFIIDPCSMNIPNQWRIPLNNLHLPSILNMSRELCFRTHSERTAALKSAKIKKVSTN